MNYDRQMIISTGNSRRELHWAEEIMWWSQLVQRPQTPARGTESLATYLRMPKAQQDDLKDVGGFVGGRLRGGRRKAHTVENREIVTLDADSIQPNGTEALLKRLSSLGCGWLAYSTRKHEPIKPRLRIIFPLNRPVSADEYEPIARKIAQMIGIDMCDPSTFQAHRLMYWPSCCADSAYLSAAEDKPFVDADGILALYTDWHDTASWPQVPGAQKAHERLLKQQSDPTTKKGAVGAFCRVYDIPAAIETFLPDEYIAVDDASDRYTYAGGSTTGGAILYNNGLFLYSHHATDPAGGELNNAFDLVRRHKFGFMDDDVKPGTPNNRYPSQQAMLQFAAADDAVSTLMRQERYAEATEDFGLDPADTSIEEDNSVWMAQLSVNPTTNKPDKTASNVLLMLKGDPLLRGRLRKDLFADRLTGVAPLPWAPRKSETGIFLWTDDDDAGLRMYTERVLGFRTRDAIEDALRQCMVDSAYNPVTDFLYAIEWDGVERLDTAIIDYLGAEDCPYIRAVTRKTFVAAIARAAEPGIKYDQMTVISGPKGIFKSTFIKLMGAQWFCDSILTFEGKEASELIQGKWIIEVAELHAMSKSDLNVVKSFLSRGDDQYRAAYGHHAESHPRRCVFFGTTNDEEYLKDPVSDRRFWPIVARFQRPTKHVWHDLAQDEVAQIWAEAVVRWRQEEPLMLSPELEEEADRRRKHSTVRDPMQGQIEEFLQQLIPENWYNMTLEQHQTFWGGHLSYEGGLIERDRVCAAEIIRECFLETRGAVDTRQAARVNRIMDQIEGWERGSTVRFGSCYGRQKGFVRTN